MDEFCFDISFPFYLDKNGRGVLMFQKLYFFARMLNILPPLPRQHMIMVVRKGPAHMNCVENFECLFKR